MPAPDRMIAYFNRERFTFMEIIWNSLLIAAAVCLVLFLLATAVGAVFFKMVLVREKHPGDPMNKSHVTPE